MRSGCEPPFRRELQPRRAEHASLRLVKVRGHHDCLHRATLGGHLQSSLQQARSGGRPAARHDGEIIDLAGKTARVIDRRRWAESHDDEPCQPARVLADKHNCVTAGALLATASEAIAAPDDLAPGLFGRALAVPGTGRFPFDLGRVRLCYGERLRRARATTDSRAQLTAAFEVFERLGATPWAARAASELRAAGQTDPRADQRGRDPLTPQELEIAELAAAGLTNKQIGQRLFLSHRTVGAHLYQIFPKLGVTSRAALRDALDSLPRNGATGNS
jgi:DNA-binding CsgD family transcriptional regulator